MRLSFCHLTACLVFIGITVRAAELVIPVIPIQATETKEQRDARMAWWREARFGMFIHWGLYAVPAGTWKGQQTPIAGEWIMRTLKIPVADYSSLTSQFNPTQFDANAWVAMAKSTGMKYIIVTAKHHDGFAMFKSKVDPYNIVDATPFKRDILKELTAACQKQGLKLGFYYSQAQDWHAAGGAPKEHWDPAQNGSRDDYLKNKVVPQLDELLTNYQPSPALIWFDTPYEMSQSRINLILPLLAKHPDLIWNDRLGYKDTGDYKTPEQAIPIGGYSGKDWETCMTMNDTWGYKSYDQNFKSSDGLIRNLVDIASKGGNFLLNVGPDATGIIPAPEVERLKAVGQWLAVNGEAIYGTGSTPFGDEEGALSPTKKDNQGKPVFIYSWNWRCTTKPGKLFIHIFRWPAAAFTLAKVKDKIIQAYMLADPQHKPLSFSQDGTEVSVTLPAKKLDPFASVLVLETSAAPGQ